MLSASRYKSVHKAGNQNFLPTSIYTLKECIGHTPPPLSALDILKMLKTIDALKMTNNDKKLF